MKKTVEEIAQIIGGEVVGDKNLVIKGISGIKEAKSGEITFLANSKYTPLLNSTKASCAITARDAESNGKLTLIKTDDPNMAFAKVVSLVALPKPFIAKEASSLAFVSKKAKLGKHVSVGPFAVIEDGAEIGDGTIIYAGVYIGHETKVGKNALIYSNVSIRERCTIGDSVIIHSGTAIGNDGFGFAAEEGELHKIPQIGTVVIEDDVEIGANVTIDRARFGKTVVGKGTKIDNLVQIAHNVTIGENSIIVSQSGISGSATLGKGVIVAGQAGIVGHVEIGDRTIIAAQAGVSRSLGKDLIVGGAPVKPLGVWKRTTACIQRLPDLFKSISGLKKRLEAIEEKVYGKAKNSKE